MARFFIDRPIFAWVISLIIMLAGILAIRTLPVSQYPKIAPPSITISAVYPGAAAKTLEDSVTQVIEQRMKGIDNLRYISSSSEQSGRASITLSFDAGTDADIAQVQVQNKLQLALPQLPQEVQQQGITVTKSSSSFLMVLGFVSKDNSLSRTDLADYAITNILDPISRVNGVGDVQVFGAQYAMRIWLDPAKLNNYKLSVQEVIAAIKAQNAQISAGQVGGVPSVPGQKLNSAIIAQSRLETAEQFGRILLRVKSDGAQVRLADVARIERDAENYEVVSRYNGDSATGLGIKLATGANALETAAAVRAKMAELKQYFPQGMDVVVPYDTTPFVKLSIEEVVKTLIEAIILVFCVMYLFMQNFRATLIPTIAVPVVLLGTFGVMSALGFSINTLTMFGMVLAIGLLVDDAIVVVENVERVMQEEGLSPKEATRKSMSQITGALVGIALVLSAVFVPMAFFGGSTGVIYRQFSITVVSAMALSVLVALTLSPALCATLLKPIAKGEHHGKSGFFGKFNQQFDRFNLRYQQIVSRWLGRSGRYVVIYLVLIGVMSAMFLRLPTSFLPEEDQGILFTQVMLPAGSTQEQTLAVLDKVEKHFMENEKLNVESVFTVAGFSFGGSGQNSGIGFVRLRDWSERKGDEQHVKAIVGRAYGAFAQIKEAMVFAFAPPAVLELGNATGFDLQLQDRGNVGHEKLTEAAYMLLGMAAKDPNVVGVRPNGQPDSPQLRLDVDQEKASALGLQISDINLTLSAAWGSAYVNDFIDEGRVKKVYLQADAPFRMKPEDLNDWYVKNASGDMVPFSSFASTRWDYGSPRLTRYNSVPSMNIQGAAAPGKSTGDAMLAMESMIAKLPPGIGYEWTGLSLEERQSGAQAPALYALSLLIVFLCLAALYESWSIPFSVMLVVPLGVIGALAATLGRGLSNDVYFQVGLLTTIGLSAKNAILIVEFAKAQVDEGMDLIDATLQAVRMRLRPIVMTSLAFGFGVLPMAIASGAGSGSQNAIGTGVVGGMLSATMLGIFFVPVFYVLISKYFSPRHQEAAAPMKEPR
ncbi:efflux RND transporter permease subunit [Chitinibacter sp. S2-10]|uniref:efflux RND transporter permease subunit n=1 Tax=Chitinibacter sp. S2-10 TaxID=3373597 RepID=UPI003977D499